MAKISWPETYSLKSVCKAYCWGSAVLWALELPQLAEVTLRSQINHFYVLSLYTPSSCTESHWLRFHTWVQSLLTHYKTLVRNFKSQNTMQRSITGCRLDGLMLKCQNYPKKATDYCLCSFGIEKINANSLIFAYLLLVMLRAEPRALHVLAKPSSSSPVHSLYLSICDHFYKYEANIKCFHTDITKRHKI